MKALSLLISIPASFAVGIPVQESGFELVSETADASPHPAIALRAASTPLVASVGSSYSYGVGLERSYGRVLADLLGQQAGLPTSVKNYFNYAFYGTTLLDVPGQAKKLGSKEYAAVVITSGGNDLKYVSCLDTPSQGDCGQTIDKKEYIRRYSAALDAVRDNTTATTPIWVVTYTQALGSHVICSSTGTLCNLTPAQADTAKGIYTKVVDWTVEAFNEWAGNNTARPLKMLTMRGYSANKHDVNATEAWCNGSKKPADNDGQKWHPNKVGAEWMGQAIFNRMNSKPLPPY